MFSRLALISQKLYVPLGWTLLTQLLLSIPGSLFRGPGFFRIPHLDKIAHLILFGGLTFFWILFYYYRHGTEKKSLAWMIILLVSLYGIAIEFFQFNFIPNRSFDIWDIVADICGAICGYLATIWILKRSTRTPLQ
ncbi:MAG TPA: VanZ family protein [Chitinophagaceae bacterium]